MKSQKQPFRSTIKILEAFTAPGDSKSKAFVKESIEVLKCLEDEGDFVDSMKRVFK